MEDASIIIGLRRLISDERWREKDECCPTFSGCFAVQEEKMQGTLASLIARSKSDIVTYALRSLFLYKKKKVPSSN